MQYLQDLTKQIIEKELDNIDEILKLRQDLAKIYKPKKLPLNTKCKIKNTSHTGTIIKGIANRLSGFFNTLLRDFKYSSNHAEPNCPPKLAKRCKDKQNKIATRVVIIYLSFI